MGVFDQDIQAARELIAEYGAACVWKSAPVRIETEPGYPTYGPQPAPVPCKIAFFSPRDLGRGSEEFLAAMAGTTVPTNRQIGLMAGDVPFTPKLDDTVTYAGTDQAIIKIDRVAPNGTPILYYITVAA